MTSPSDNKKKDRRNNPDYWQGRHFRVQRLIAIGGLLGICLLSFQWCEMRKSTEAATDSARAANKSVRLAKESSHLDQRAWVATIEATSPALKGGGKMEITIPIKNSGKTFAREVTVSANVLEFHQRTGNPPLGDDSHAAITRGLLLAPDATYRIHFITDNALPEDVDSAIQSGEERVFTFGRITYFDIFDCVHWTLYCYVFDPARGTWNICEEHNEADNDRCDEATTK